MAAVVPHFLSYWLGISIWMGLGLLAIYLLVDREWIKRRALRRSKELLEPMWDTTVDLSSATHLAQRVKLA